MKAGVTNDRVQQVVEVKGAGVEIGEEEEAEEDDDDE